jgi:NUMOD4 motif-containing protein/HNH endonuclease
MSDGEVRGQPERWQPIPGYPGYDASDRGRVRSFRRARTPGRILLPHLNKKTGYSYMTIRSATGSSDCCLVHRLVAAAFYGAITPGMVVNHKDGNRQNNRAENLEVARPAFNIQHRMLREWIRSIIRAEIEVVLAEVVVQFNVKHRESPADLPADPIVPFVDSEEPPPA